MSDKGKILVLDDDRLVLATLVQGLTQAGYQVIDADNGDDAILLAREHRPQLALLDIRMEGKSGFDVAAYLRDHLGIAFMFLSAFSDAATVAQVKALGAIAYLVKPLDIRQIVPAVQAAFANLDRSAGQQAGRGTTGPGNDPPLHSVSIAVGVLMHRFSLNREAALDRLARLAAAEDRSLEAQSQQLLEGIEVLAEPVAVSPRPT